MRFVSKSEYLIMPKVIKFEGSGKLGFNIFLGQLFLFSCYKINCGHACCMYLNNKVIFPVASFWLYVICM